MTWSPRNKKFPAILAGLSLIGGMIGGCGLDLEPDSVGVDTMPADPSGGAQRASTVTIRFRNFARVDAVDVQFFATNEPLMLLPDELFVPENSFTRDVGIVGLGIIERLREDTITFPCSESLAIGTLGGRFLDNDTGDHRGEGVPRWAQQGPLALCGSVVTFEFSGGDGEFNTNLKIGE